MLNMSRRGLLASAALGAAFGLGGKVAFINPAHAETPLEPTTGFYKYKVGSIEVTAVYDGIWRKPHDPTFIKNASVEETKAALAKAGLTTEFMPIPLTVIVLKIGDKHIMVDSGSGVGQWQANATNLPANMKAAGIDRNQISTILVSHFHPDHVWGLMEKGTNARLPQRQRSSTADIIGDRTAGSRKLAEGRRAAGKRIAENSDPRTGSWCEQREVAPGSPDRGARPTPVIQPSGASGKDRLMVSNDLVRARLLARAPGWQAPMIRTVRWRSPPAAT